MTKFISLIEKPKDKTVFTAGVNFNVKTEKGCVEKTILKPTDYEEVIWLGHDKIYGDVFKAVKKDDSFTIFFGKKGSEFN